MLPFNKSLTQVPIGLGLQTKSSNLSTTDLVRSPDNFTGGITSSENIISTTGFDQLLQSVIGLTKTKKRSITKKRRKM
jgi:hypothetical protein